MGDWVILFGKNLFFRPNLLWSNMIAIFGCTYKTITRCKICFTLRLSNYFSLKSLRICLKFTWTCPKVNWFVDYKFTVWFQWWILTEASLLALAKSIYYSFSWTSVRTFLWCYYRWFIVSLALEKYKKEWIFFKIILLQGFLPLKIKISQFPGGFRLNSLAPITKCKLLAIFGLLTGTLVVLRILISCM